MEANTEVDFKVVKHFLQLLGIDETSMDSLVELSIKDDVITVVANRRDESGGFYAGRNGVIQDTTQILVTYDINIDEDKVVKKKFQHSIRDYLRPLETGPTTGSLTVDKFNDALNRTERQFNVRKYSVGYGSREEGIAAQKERLKRVAELTDKETRELSTEQMSSLFDATNHRAQFHTMSSPYVQQALWSNSLSWDEYAEYETETEIEEEP